MTGILGFCVHIPTGSRRGESEATTDKFLRALGEFDAVLVLDTKNPKHYAASFALPTRKEQIDFWRELVNLRIKAVAGLRPVFIAKRFLGELTPEAWREREGVVFD